MTESGGEVFAGSAIGSRLKAAREEKGVSLDDIAMRTRIPTRHLKAIEDGEWDTLPAATYTVGFARSYANAVGLNGIEIGAAVRAELGGREAAPAAPIYEPADPARVPPKALVVTAGVIAVVLAVGYGIWRSASFDDPGAPEIAAVAPAQRQAAPTVAAAPRAPPAADAPVVLTAVSDVWLRVYEAGGERLYEATMKAGDSYQVPATAQAPQILTGRPDALRITVGTTPIPPLGEPERTIADVSLKPADLIARATGPQAPPQAAPAPGA